MASYLLGPADGQFLLGTGHSHIKHAPLFFQIRFQHRFLVRRYSFRRIQDKYLFIFQSFAAVHSGQMDTILYFLLPLFQLLHLFCIFFNIDKPFFIGMILSGTLLQI